jgi:tyrosine-protein kinase Etk/Wzc
MDHSLQRAPETVEDASLGEDPGGLLEVLIVLGRRKWLVLGLPALAGALALAVTFFVPKIYTATAKLLLPQQSQSTAAMMLGQLSTLSGGGAAALGVRNPNDVFVAMLNSRTVADSLIRDFNLMAVYGEKLTADARKMLAANTYIRSGKDSVITIEVDDQDAVRAAGIANGYIKELDKLTMSLAVSEASTRRLFFEKQLARVKHDLTEAEIAFQRFQEETGVLNPAGQAGLTVSAAASLRAQITAREVQLETAQSFATEQNPEVIRLRRELHGLRQQLAKMEQQAGEGAGDVLVSIGKVPRVSAEYLKRLRELKYYEALFELLAKQYELARVDEAKNATVIQVLDAALAPERHSKPKRLLITLTTIIVGMIGAAIAAVMLEIRERTLLDPARASRLLALRAAWF